MPSSTGSAHLGVDVAEKVEHQCDGCERDGGIRASVERRQRGNVKAARRDVVAADGRRPPLPELVGRPRIEVGDDDRLAAQVVYSFRGAPAGEIPYQSLIALKSARRSILHRFPALYGIALRLCAATEEPVLNEIPYK